MSDREPVSDKRFIVGVIFLFLALALLLGFIERMING